MNMKNKKYKILFFNNRKGSIKEINFSKWLIFLPLSILLVANFLFFNYLAEGYVIWKCDVAVQDHKKNNETLVTSIYDSENKISNIEEKLNNIIEHDNNIRGLLKLPQIHDDVRELGTGGPAEAQSIEDLK